MIQRRLSAPLAGRRDAGPDLVLTVVRRCRRLVASALVVCGFGMCAAGAAQAEPYPSKPIRLVVPVSAGGGLDGTTRLVAQHLSQRLGQQVVVDNKPGASGVIAMEAVARAAPDGYTLIMSASTMMVVNPVMMPSLPYDPIADFEPVAHLGSGLVVMIAHPDFPANDIGELVALAKKQPGQISYGTWGTGSTAYICMQMIVSTTGVELTHVPYKGGAPLLTDMYAGHVKLGFAESITATAAVREGRVKPLGTCAGKHKALPDVKSFREQGIPFDFLWHFIALAPAGTPAAIVERLNKEIVDISTLPDVKRRWAEAGMLEPFMARAEIKEVVRREIETLKAVASKANVKPE
ncbi:tripartite tricarboxylate transporter substrate binding protein [Vineibacter terrae]|uniref:Bug family tripartite tricarboxylate transporter substrate binding protein n=1 Tax=Vineibacter terrae TaxID=2586908 RepID=UPI002E356386|nr:tripartite tricarboxylate transporter substrate binding protein [Vineibacter terrae]HEX2888346.1 tripartite tricarboxylate transporter substrate binding protein [Vineibacter terrae]